MKASPKGVRLHIGIFGRRNAGKSSILNALAGQEISIVSEVPGTTTDPVEKAMELLPLGPVLFLDTAGIDDTGALGESRTERTRRIFERTDIGIVVAAAGCWGDHEERILEELRARGAGVVVAWNRSDEGLPEDSIVERLSRESVVSVRTTASLKAGIDALREALVHAAPSDFLDTPTILGDLVSPGDSVILVVPIDQEAPRGRLILPQVQTIRDVLDNDAWCVVVKESELSAALARLSGPPALVVTDSQAFPRVAADTPESVPMTSFSILFSRYRGDLEEFVRGAAAIDALRPGDRVLIAEACTHHPTGDDIGRVKIPRWLSEYVGGPLEFVHAAGHDWPEELSGFRLVIHCGACMMNRREVLTRILRCRRAAVPVTNYGMAIARSLGVFDRALAPFPGALSAWRTASLVSRKDRARS